MWHLVASLAANVANAAWNCREIQQAPFSNPAPYIVQFTFNAPFTACHIVHITGPECHRAADSADPECHQGRFSAHGPRLPPRGVERLTWEGGSKRLFCMSYMGLGI